MPFIDDLVKGFTSGTISGIGDALTSLIEEFHLSPEAAAKIEQVKAELALRQEELVQKGIESARAREMAVRDKTPSYLAYLSLAVFTGLTAAVIFHEVPKDSHDIVIALIAWVGGFVSAAFMYYFGTSSSSSEKNAIIEKLSHR